MKRTPAGSGRRKGVDHNAAPAPAPAPAFDRGDWPALAAAVLGPLVVYALTAPHNVVLEDDGLFILAGVHLGVAHPPGYPLHTLIVHLFTQLPFGTPAFLAHLSSALPGALACGLVYGCARLHHCAMLPALTAAWLFGVSEHFWSQAIITEVYTLNAFFLFAVYALLLWGARQPQRAWIWPAAALLFGLSLANHWPLMLLAAPGLALAALPAWRAVLVRLPTLAAIAATSAGLPYAWMVWRSWQDTPVSFAGPIDGWHGFWFYLSRGGYAGVDSSAAAGWSDRFEFLRWFGNEIVWQLTLPGFALALCGLWVLFRHGRRAEGGSGLVVFASQSVVLITLLAFEFTPVRLAIFRPYSLICYGLAAIWLAVGMQFCLSRLDRTHPRNVAAATAGVAMVAGSLYVHWPANDRSGDDFAARYAETVFNLLPQHAVLFARGDTESGPLGYHHLVQSQRPDVTLLTGEALIFASRLYPPSTPDSEKRAAIRRFVSDTDRPVFLTTHAAEAWFPDGFGHRRHGLFREVLRHSEPDGIVLTHHDEWDRYFRELAGQRHTDRAAHITQKRLLLEQGGYLGYVVLSNDPGLLARTERSRRLAEQDFFSLLGMARVLVTHWTPEHGAQAEAWLAKMDGFHDDVIDDGWRARAAHLKSVLKRRRAP